ncbi:MAG TPA: hypothetical protein VJA16_01845 [Thermoanaerobaculia bacterium]
MCATPTVRRAWMLPLLALAALFGLAAPAPAAHHDAGTRKSGMLEADAKGRVLEASSH